MFSGEEKRKGREGKEGKERRREEVSQEQKIAIPSPRMRCFRPKKGGTPKKEKGEKGITKNPSLRTLSGLVANHRAQESRSECPSSFCH